MMRVATFSQSAQMTTMALNNQAKVSEASVQVATGYKTQMLADLGGADVIPDHRSDGSPGGQRGATVGVGAGAQPCGSHAFHCQRDD